MTADSTKPRILFIDDEIAIAKMQKQMLGRSGYDVEIYTCANDALACFKENPDGFDVVITDMTMPDMTGDELALKIKAIRKVPVILCTGYSEKMDGEDPHAFGIDLVLFKPISRNDLVMAIEQIL